MANTSKAEMLAALRALLRETLALQTAGATHPRLSRASGMLDGYMRALLDSGLCTEKELLALVAAERSASFGAATGTLAADSAFLAA